jgi:hypothetical protein
MRMRLATLQPEHVSQQGKLIGLYFKSRELYTPTPFTSLHVRLHALPAGTPSANAPTGRYDSEQLVWTGSGPRGGRPPGLRRGRRRRRHHQGRQEDGQICGCRLLRSRAGTSSSAE